METVVIGDYRWKKFKGDEGQDVYVAQFLLDEDRVLGQYVDKSSYDILIDEDADFYLPDDSLDDEDNLNEDRLAFKFRKNVFTAEEQQGALEGLWGAAGESNNRGLAAGPREERNKTRDWVTNYQSEVLNWYAKGQPVPATGEDPIQVIKENLEKKEALGENIIRGMVWLRTAIEKEYESYEAFFPELEKKLSSMTVSEATAEAKRIQTKFISDTSYATAIWSGIAGYYGRYPRIPYGRPTAYTEHHLSDFEKSYPFARKLDKTFAELMPVRYGRQKEFADRLDNRFLIGGDTTFTTITVNTTTKDRNARMACHRDQGSLVPGFSNLTVVTEGNKGWKGGYLVAPEVRAAINVRPGDLLLIDNMRVIHGNTPIESPESGDDDLLRMSLVYYFREDMDKLGSWEYESLRRAYVDERRKNEEHEHWRKGWNGVSPGMWEEREWYDWLGNMSDLMLGDDSLLREYHPEAFDKEGTLEEFFG